MMSNSTYKNPIARNGDFADPFVLRHNGVYYLYATNPGVPVWTSLDLVNWEKRGNSVQDATFPDLVPFAPEVVYREGAFYMYTSPSGRGHAVLRASDPLGPFVTVAENVGHSIDGHVFDDGDGRSYFYWAGDEGIWAAEITTPTTFGEPVLTGAFMNGWTEGPLILKRDGIYHMTLTGNHYLSPGYRIDAAVSESPETGYRPHPLNPILVSTVGEVVGLGHSSSVIGPDLVSTYMIYHNLNQDASRDLNLDRQVFHGGLTHVHGPSREAPTPGRPDAEFRPGATDPDAWHSTSNAVEVRGDELVVKSGGRAVWLAATAAAGSDFVAEFSLRSNGGLGSHGVLIEDTETGEPLLTLEMSHREPVLQAVGPGSLALEQVALRRSEIVGALHTIGVSRAGSRWDVAFNGRSVLTIQDGSEAAIVPSVFGHGSDVLIGYCALTRCTALASDRASVKPVPGRFPADVSAANQRVALQTGSDVPLEAVVLERGDEISYDLLVHQGGMHDVMLQGDFEAGTRIEIHSGVDSTVVASSEGDRGLSARLELPAGRTPIQLSTLVGKASISLLNVQICVGGAPPTTQLTLRDHDKAVVGQIPPGAFSARATVRWNEQADARADVIFLATELAYGEEGDDARVGHNFFLGYSVQVSSTKVVLARHSFDERVLASTNVALTPSTPHVVAISFSGGHITVAVDGDVTLRATDPLPHLHGGIGLRANVGFAYLLDLVVEQG